MFDDGGFVHGDPHWRRQEMVLDAAAHRADLEQIGRFTRLADTVLASGRDYNASLANGLSDAVIAEKLRRPIALLQRAGELALIYAGVAAEDLLNATVQALKIGTVGLQDLRRAMTSEPAMARMLNLPGSYADAVLDWRELLTTEDSPSVALAAYQLAGHWGMTIDRRTYDEMAGQLASAFPPEWLTVAEAEDLIKASWGRLLTPELADELAAEAIERMRKNRRIRLSAPWTAPMDLRQYIAECPALEDLVF